MFIRNLATADFDIFSQGVEGLAGGWKFFAADAAQHLACVKQSQIVGHS